MPERFNTRKETQKALDTFLEEATEYDSEEFKIEEITRFASTKEIKDESY